MFGRTARRETPRRTRAPECAEVEGFEPINDAIISILQGSETGQGGEMHRGPNRPSFPDGPPCWLEAATERYYLESGAARPGLSFFLYE
jgi:N12 class adenine-specific DNA methylase